MEKPERIGKKYQWIAYYEILARVADNLEYRGRYGEDERKQYAGPWQIGYVRNIDPSVLLEMPEPQDLHNIFFGELFRLPAYLHQHDSFSKYTEWTLGEGNPFPHPITTTSEHYVWERGYDCSIEDTIGICIPSGYLAEHMNLRWNGVEGVFSNSADETVAFDPSVQEKGPSTLLIRKDVLVDFLEKNDLSTIWILRGEKNAYGHHPWAEQFLGRLYVSGVYRLSKGDKAEGILNSVFEPRDSRKESHASISFSQANNQSKKSLKTIKDQAERNPSNKE